MDLTFYLTLNVSRVSCLNVPYLIVNDDDDNNANATLLHKFKLQIFAAKFFMLNCVLYSLRYTAVGTEMKK